MRVAIGLDLFKAFIYPVDAILAVNHSAINALQTSPGFRRISERIAGIGNSDPIEILRRNEG